MLTRLKINGFKNLVDIDLRFGPFTCIAGGNGVGKSNIFDAIQFLSLLADKPFSDAASLVRAKNDSSNEKRSFIESIFHRVGNEYLKHENRMEIEVEMIIPTNGKDELGQPAKATCNLLKYSLELGLTIWGIPDSNGPIKIYKEELISISKDKSNEHLLFDHQSTWRDSVIRGDKEVAFISTSGDKDEILIHLHEEGGNHNSKPKSFTAKDLPRTVLSTANYAAETPTLLLTRREMQSWRLLQLEPSSLRNHDELSKYPLNSKLGSDGSHLPSVIYKLANYDFNKTHNPNDIYVKLANRLSELIPDIQSVTIDKDEKRQLLTLNVIGRDGTILPARSLSDGTLRFLALAVLDLDFTETGLICLEEPENGIYPDRIPAIIELLKSIPVDPFEENNRDNPIRQIIINTHSPKVVYEIPDASLVYVELREFVKKGMRFKGTQISALSDTWRTSKGGVRDISKGKLLAYFNLNNNADWLINQSEGNPERKIRDREDLKILQGKLFTK